MDSAGPISKVFFLWVQPVLRAGWRQPLQNGQAPPFPKRLQGSLQKRFNDLWADELRRSSRKGPSLRRARPLLPPE